MIFPWLTQLDTSARHVLMFDIASDGVTGAYISYREGKRPHITHIHREQHAPDDEKSYERLLVMTEKSLKECARAMLEAVVHPPQEIITIMHGPWVMGYTRVLHTHSKQPFVFTQDFANALIQKEIDAFHQKTIPEFHSYADDHVLLEHKTMHVALNGYPVHEPLGKKAKRAEITSFMSMMPRMLHDRITYRIGHFFHAHQEFHSALFASYATLRHVLRHEHNGLLVDIGAEITEIGLMHKDALVQTVSFPFGYYDLYRLLAKQAALDLSEAETLWTLYAHNTLDEDRRDRYQDIFDQGYLLWVRQFHAALQKAFSAHVLPRHVFLYVAQPLGHYFKDALHDDYVTHYNNAQDAYAVTLIDKNTLKGSVIDETGLFDPHVLNNALFTSLIQPSSADDTMYW
ncbi:MAG: hypothetical protein LRY41_01260 [Candidatus Pacebacteria bacterium]|nr:hypothetical protein [Candidatus Paceibacterota bacterium]MCD8527945.1 hypothetical protein [Candidatus Paceibacterota bacterium]MCD8563940.1 hypothetical protein [Candidatus Paceibacterota bacterium]